RSFAPRGPRSDSRGEGRSFAPRGPRAEGDRRPSTGGFKKPYGARSEGRSFNREDSRGPRGEGRSFAPRGPRSDSRGEGRSFAPRGPRTEGDRRPSTGGFKKPYGARTEGRSFGSRGPRSDSRGGFGDRAPRGEGRSFASRGPRAEGDRRPSTGGFKKPYGARPEGRTFKKRPGTSERSGLDRVYQRPRD
ncbi:MAG: hypothetical protein IT286_00305, partial [Proteobacteria bacterium]|nr:hypothetical protein [Pseudomonadota bacterium]